MPPGAAVGECNPELEVELDEGDYSSADDVEDIGMDLHKAQGLAAGSVGKFAPEVVVTHSFLWQ